MWFGDRRFATIAANTFARLVSTNRLHKTAPVQTVASSLLLGARSPRLQKKLYQTSVLSARSVDRTSNTKKQKITFRNAKELSLAYFSVISVKSLQPLKLLRTI